MVKIELIGGDTVAAVLRSWEPKLQSEIRASIGRSVLRMQRHIGQNKLSGQVLNVQTGTLRRSIDQVVQSDGNAVHGIVNTNVRYGAAHEYGFTGTVNVKAHLRHVRQVFGRPLKHPKYVQVGSHSRSVKLPERSFLRSALRDMRPQIEADLKQSLERALR